MEQLSVTKTIWINAPREKVWSAVTSAEQLMIWWGDHWEIESLDIGATIRFGFADDVVLAKVGVVEPPHKFVIQWPPHPGYNVIDVTTTFLLEEENGGTRVTVTETGFEAMPDDVRQTRYDSTANGYERVLQGLKELMEKE
jgi:uncharacterized protein YndB with AHSA1/START domain